jgi:hypothetical protein
MALPQEIFENTRRVVTSAGITKKNEFKYQDGKFVDPEIPYHIRYLLHPMVGSMEAYLTGEETDKFKSKLIIRTKNFSLFAKYKQAKIGETSQTKFATPYTFAPTDEDYSNGSAKRYFLRKSNDKGSPYIEVKAAEFKRLRNRGFYVGIELIWQLVGTMDEVQLANSTSISFYGKVLSDENFGKGLNTLQFWEGFDLDVKEKTLKRLSKRLKFG